MKETVMKNLLQINKKKVSIYFTILILSIILLNSCISLKNEYSDSVVFQTVELPVSLTEINLTIGNRNMQNRNASHAIQYADTILVKHGFNVSPDGDYILRIDLKEQAIYNALDGKVSLSAVASLINVDNGLTMSRVIYTVESKRGYDSDPEVYKTLKILIKNLSTSIQKSKV